MQISKEKAYSIIEGLVERFTEQHSSYINSDYNETLTRRDFIDPFFKALGWDVDNSEGYAESYREVIHEDRIKIGSATKAPDYSFRLAGGKKLFFVEAKKPSVSVKNAIQPAYQVRRYGWSAKMPLSVITDFEEFAIYDCSKRPSPTDKTSVARIKYLTYKEYLTEFDFIWNTFSKEQVLKGSFDKFILGTKGKRGTATVDKEFLVSLDNWRTYLATSISWNNKELDIDEINFVVQQTLDRIIFLRIAEGRGVEPEDSLQQCIKHGNFYDNLFQQFKQADEKYNSGLFDFKKDKISKGLVIENKIIKTIINQLYYPESPYEFEVLPVEILGNAYEQFLGKTITLDKLHRARIELKPEVRKAGGVYYTPEYIVDYIVANTVGKLIAGKKPDEVSKITIVDPACGSGSFLIGAYQYLLDYHKNYYSNNGKPSKGNKNNPLTPAGNLTTAEKKRILLNNIYGVDIDVNAVEVTKLSLLLKCMEGETQASIAHQLSMFNDRVLPTLDNNIKSGNSLIDTDYYDGQLFETEKKIKPFNWRKEFPDVFKIQRPDANDELKYQVSKIKALQKDTEELIEKIKSKVEEPPEGYDDAGFDIVIGNPPYVRQELLGEQKQYFESHYRVYHGTADLYSYFIEKGIGLLNKNGVLGIIVANKWMRANYGEPLRIWIKKQNLFEIIDFGDLPVFEQATTYPCIFICGKGKIGKNFDAVNVKTLKFESLEKYVLENRFLLEQNALDDKGFNLASDVEQRLLKKLNNAGVPLGEYVKGKIYRGVLTGLNKAFVINKETKEKLIKEDKRSAELIKPFLAGRDIKRYSPPTSDNFLIFTKRGIDIDKYPAIKSHLLEFKKQLTPKPKNFKGEKWEGRKPGNYKWFEIQDSIDYYKEFEKPKIIYPNILKQPEFTFDLNGWFTNQKCFIISLDDKYLLGLLNSNLNYYLFEKNLPKLRGGFYEPSYVFFKHFPIKKIDSKNINEFEQKKIIEKLVEQLLQLNEEKANTKLETKLNQLQSKIDYCEEKINTIVYQLYELTNEEIKIIEGK